MPKKHRPKRGVVRKAGNEIYFAYVVLMALCFVFALHLITDSGSVANNDERSQDATGSSLRVEPPSGNGQGGQEEALNESLQSSSTGQEALQGSVNSQSSGVGSDQLQPSTGKDEYEAYENQ